MCGQREGLRGRAQPVVLDDGPTEQGVPGRRDLGAVVRLAGQAGQAALQHLVEPLAVRTLLCGWRQRP